MRIRIRCAWIDKEWTQKAKPLKIFFVKKVVKKPLRSDKAKVHR